MVNPFVIAVSLFSLTSGEDESAVETTNHMTEYLIVASNMLLVVVTGILIIITVHESAKTARAAMAESAKENKILAKLLGRFIAASDGEHRKE